MIINDTARLLARSLGTLTVPEGEGWFTTAEFAQQEGIVVRTAHDRLVRGIKVGLLETAKFCPKRSNKSTIHYKLNK